MAAAEAVPSILPLFPEAPAQQRRRREVLIRRPPPAATEAPPADRITSVEAFDDIVWPRWLAATHQRSCRWAGRVEFLKHIKDDDDEKFEDFMHGLEWWIRTELPKYQQHEWVVPHFRRWVHDHRWEDAPPLERRS